MEKLRILNKIKQIYFENKNIIKYLKGLDNREKSTTEDILISYDFQAGSYIDSFEKDPETTIEYCVHLAEIIDRLAPYDSLIEVGVGEATTFANTVLKLKHKPSSLLGFDISWSRVKYAEKFISSNSLNNVRLFVGDLFCIPLQDCSIDIVYTSHSLEPNGGKERECLEELYRIANKYIVLLEPSYELATSEKAKERMLSHGYITKLYSTAIELGYEVIEHRLFDVHINPLNPTGLMVIKKNQKDMNETPTQNLCCPLTKTILIKNKNTYFSQESLLAYPIIGNIPCLLPQNAVVATKFLETDW